MIIKGQREYQKFIGGQRLTHRQAILAQCYSCNGSEEGGDDCKGESCPLYLFMPYRIGHKKRRIGEEERQRLIARLAMGRNRKD